MIADASHAAWCSPARPFRGAAAAATVVSRTAAQQKLSQGDAKYETAPNGDHRCEGCANFQAPNGCKFVQGDISPNGWCQLFVGKS
jgi:hypothetical protein